MKFSKKQRLLKKEEFSAVFEIAHLGSARSDNILHLSPYVVYRNPNHPEPRLGLSIARRVMKSSCERNRVKRCVRDFFRTHQKELEGDLIVRLVSRPKDFEYATLTHPLERLLKVKI